MKTGTHELAEFFREKKALITGGAGFIGSTLARALADMDCHVTVIDSLIPQYGGNMFNLAGYENKIRINISDVRDSYSLQPLVQGQNFLFNLAGQNSHLDSMEDPFTDMEINCRATLSILEACRRHNPEAKIIYASTRQIYGRPNYLPVDEKHPLNPVDVNGIHKLAGEFYHTLYHRVYGLHTCSLRLTNTIGPRMRIKDSRQTFLGVWVRLLLENKPFEVWEGEQLRDFSYVDDVVEALLRAAATPSGEGLVLNIGGCPAVRLRELAEKLVKANGGGKFEVKNFPEHRKRIDIGDYHSNDQLARSLLKWKPRAHLEEMLDKTLAYYREHLTHYI